MNIPEDFAEKADAHLRAWMEVDQFSGSVLVAWDDEVLLSQGYGLANREHGVPNTPETKFRLGSVTKQFTAAAILVLQEQGKLKVADLLSDYVDDSPEAWENVTLHHLRNHSSGIPNYTDFIDSTEARTPLGTSGTVALFKDKPLDFAPGARFSYSNSGYHMLGCVIEKASGKPYDEFLKKVVFDPLRMADSGYDSTSALIARRASGYSLAAGDWKNAAYLDMGIPYAAGGLYSTTEDLLQWSRGLDAASLLSPESMRTMNSLSPLLTNYGYGVAMRELHGHRWIDHGGGIHGFCTDLKRCPEEKACLVVLSNLESANPDRLARDLVNLLAGEPCTTPVVSGNDDLSQYEGDYELAPGIRLTVTATAPGLTVGATGGVEATLLAEGDDLFFHSRASYRIRFKREGDGAVSHLVLEQDGLEERGEKV